MSNEQTTEASDQARIAANTLRAAARIYEQASDEISTVLASRDHAWRNYQAQQRNTIAFATENEQLRVENERLKLRVAVLESDCETWAKECGR